MTAEQEREAILVWIRAMADDALLAALDANEEQRELLRAAEMGLRVAALGIENGDHIPTASGEKE